MKTFFLTIIIFVLQSFTFAQTNIENEVKKFSCSCENKKAVREYFEQYENQQKFIAQCEREDEEKRISLNLPKPVKVSGFGPSPVNLVQPSFPNTAKRLKISGLVLVEVFTDEMGFVIYSKALKGSAFLRESAKKAACHSRFSPITYCGKAVKARWLIKYNFISN